MRSKTQSPTSARRSQTSWVLPRSTTIPATSTMAYPSLSGLRGWSGTSSLWGRRRERKNNRSSFMCERASNASKRLRIDAERARDYADSLLNRISFGRDPYSPTIDKKITHTLSHLRMFGELTGQSTPPPRPSPRSSTRPSSRSPAWRARRCPASRRRGRRWSRARP